MSAQQQPRTNNGRSDGQPAAKRRRPHKKPTTPKSAPTGPLSARISQPGSLPTAAHDTTPALTPFQNTPASTRATTPGQEESSRGFTQLKFEDLLRQGSISEKSFAGIASLRPPHVFCTPVQEATLPVILTGVDVLAQAKTGTGKTLGFLVPSIELLLRNPPRSDQISILIISPTRELAIQIETAAEALLSATEFKCQHVVGGTNMNSETKNLNSKRCDILVATPGRLLDHLENSNLRPKLGHCRALILDEADRLLEQGFRKEIEKIIGCLPDRNRFPRQTLLFSATIPAQVHQIASLALLPGHSFITTINPEEENTHKHVPQFVLITPLADMFALTLAVIKTEMQTHGNRTKIKVFLPTARATGLAAALFTRFNLSLPIYEIHSRKSQSARNQAADAYKLATGAILFSSDVTARGMDFPHVTTVLQVGLPSAPEQYIHRLGRTARAGTSGCGILILTPFEQFFLRKREISALPIEPHPLTETTLSTMSPTLQTAREETQHAMSTVDDELKSQFYGASLGFYKAFLKDSFGGKAGEMVRVFNEFATSPQGLAYARASGVIPEIPAQTVGKMGLRGTPGLNIIPGNGKGERQGQQGGGSRGGGARGGASSGRGRGGANSRGRGRGGSSRGGM